MQFYGQLNTFKRELAMFDIPVLRESLLHFVMAADNSDGRLTGPSGFAFPPFAITERYKPCALPCESWASGLLRV